MTINHDRLFKELITTFFDEFVQLFLPEINQWLEPGSVVFLDKEIFTDILEGESHEADLVATGRFRGGQACFLIHIEAQSSRQGRFAQRMFKYFARLHERYGWPVYPVAVLSYDWPRTPEPDYYTLSFPDRQVLDFRFRTVQLNRLDWREYLHSHNPVASALMAKMAVDPADRVRVKAECLRLLVTLKLDPARSRFISGFIDTYLRLGRDETQRFEHWLKTEIPLNEQEKIMELTTSWKEEGLQLGLQQGRQEGRQEGESSVLKRLLARRFKTLSPDVLLRIEQAVPEQLETWIENTLDATTLEEVFKDH